LSDALLSVGQRLSDQSLRGALTQGSQQSLHGRMLLLAELVGMEVGESADDGEGCQLGLGRQPDLDQSHVRVEL
jgi:hypothetical protein